MLTELSHFAKCFGVCAILAEAGVRAAPFRMLPKDKYDAWSEVVVNFKADGPTP
ncbi:hypothetical protein GGQ65_002824 [Rhizobium fabae]|uniref:Uncharacterized protein n=1 Tax=Rhizobium fabae TaxID=573179 RepID=A0A7W6B8E6_9HYPH|nr:hypothetical protein [Rhizobium fabae]